MYIPLNTVLAQRIGLNDSIVATYLWDETVSYGEAFIPDAERPWVRAGAPMLSNHLSCLSVGQVRSALRRLVKSCVIRRSRRNAHPFDMTYSYSFSDAGIALMKACSEGRKNLS